ncbi:hypothetical protein N9863_02120 [Flavobacteriaceae bacterium]|nr:hypothetical protein [Flavobacteriaceae bacterium]
MCISPNNISEVGLVACHKCWQCRENKVNDYVGRCIAESHHSDETLSITLTYGDGDTPESATLVYKHYQLFMKSLRNEGYKVRYIVAGEYGSIKGRAHWHAILFFKGKVPKNIEYDKRINWKHWNRGYSYIEKPSYKSYRYVMKYILKDTNQDIHNGHFALSKKPPLGDTYFRELAKKYVDSGLAPQTFMYQFDNEFDGQQKRREFMIQGKTRENFCKYYLHEWLEQNAFSHKKMPYSDIIEEYEDTLIGDDPIVLWQNTITELANKNDNWNPVSLENYDDTHLVIKSMANEWNLIKYNTMETK